ncbi:MAG: hypothetical protein II994_05655 [Lachnospiraceae bacterium]|nr:hypothetical protein [Lachnospiraceae bacterium]
MKRITGTILKTIGILLGGTLLGAALLAIAFAVPVGEKNITNSYEIIESEGWYPAIPMVTVAYDEYFHSYLPGVLDGGTDRIMLKTAMQPREENVLFAAMDMNGYDYYWHGYVTILRPLFALFDYGEIRTLNGMAQLLVIAFLFAQVYRKKGLPHAVMVLTSYFLLMSMAMPFSLQYSWVFYVAVGSALVIVTGDRATKWTGIKSYWFFMVVGMCTSFFDLLTYPLFTWAFPLLWLLLFREENQKAFSYVKEVIFSGLWWILGYAGLWILKWALGSLVLGRNIFESAMEEVFFRLGTAEVESFNFMQRLEVMYMNWKHYEYKIFVLILGAWLVWFAVQSLCKGVCYNAKNNAYALIAFSAIVWYFVLANHTGGHHFFTYRIYGVSILAILMIFTGSVGNTTITPKRRIHILGLWCGVGILACGLTLLAREDIDVINGDRDYVEIMVSPNEICEMRFTPTFSTIKQLGICAETASSTGTCNIRILDGEEIVYEEKIPLEDYEDTTYAKIPVSWKLKSNYDYRMEISFEGAEKETFLLVSENMDAPINEYGQISVGDKLLNGQLLSGIIYSYRPLSKFTLAFLVMTWCGVLFAMYVAFGKTNCEKDKIVNE